MKKILASLIVTAMLFSCNQSSTQTTLVKVPVDSLITNWGNVWNNHDSAGVSNLFAADPLLIDDDLIANNTAEIAAKWIHPNINVVSHFKSTKLQEWFSEERAGYSGKYEFDVVVKDSIVAKPRGVYTVNWMKTDKGEWKITTVNIHGIVEKK